MTKKSKKLGAISKPSKDAKEKGEEIPFDISLKIKEAQNEAFTNLMHFCSNIHPQYDEIMLSVGAGDFANFSNLVFDEIEQFKLRVSKIPLLSIIVLWANSSSQDRVFGARHIKIMQELLEKKLIEYRHSYDDELVLLAEFAGLGHLTTLDRIRCYKGWPINKREDYVKFYVEFANWLSEESFGYVSRAVDPDRTATANRSLPFDIYISIIMELADREKILAKIFYLGGARSLEEVLSLKIEDINSKECILRISGEAIRYPKHVFEDLREYVNARKKGYVFVSQQGDRINHTVPYRALKTVITKLKLDPSFTFKDFVTNV